jgi:hypothetical protein
MNATEHTPAPWRVAEYYGDDDDSWFFCHTVYGPAGEFVCHTSMTAVWGGTNEHAAANARLIAAAPELLELAESFLHDLEHPGSPLTKQGRSELTALARSVIAKVKGGAA